MKAKLRRPAIISNSFGSCIEALNDYHFEDGEIILGRYTEGSSTKQLIAIGGADGEFELFFPYSSRNHTIEDILSFISSSDGSHSATDAISYIKQNIRKTSTGEYVISNVGAPDNNLLTLSDVITAIFGSVKNFNNEFNKSRLSYVGKNLLKNHTNFKRGDITSGLTVDNTFFANFIKIEATISNNGIWSNFISIDDLQAIENQFEEGDDFTVSFLMSYYNAEKFGMDAVEVAIENQGKPTFLLKGVLGYSELSGELSSDISTLSYSGKWRKSGDITPQFNFSNSQGTFIIYAWKIEKSSTPTEFYIQQSELVSILASSKRKIDILSNEIDSLNKKITKLSKSTDYPSILTVVNDFSRLAKNTYKGEDKPRNNIDFLNRYPKGIGKFLLNEMISRVFGGIIFNEKYINRLDFISYIICIFAENVSGIGTFRDIVTDDNMNVTKFFKNIKQIHKIQISTGTYAFDFLDSFIIWYYQSVPDNYNYDASLSYLITHDIDGYYTNHEFTDGRDDINDTTFDHQWEYVKNIIVVLKIILLLYSVEDPVGYTALRYHKNFNIT